VAAEREGVTLVCNCEKCFFPSQDVLSQDRLCFVGTGVLTHSMQPSTSVIFSSALSLPAVILCSGVQRMLGAASLTLSFRGLH